MRMGRMLSGGGVGSSLSCDRRIVDIMGAYDLWADGEGDAGRWQRGPRHRHRHPLVAASSDLAWYGVSP